jgi:hypothetical protein
MLSEALSREDGTIMCIQWLSWAGGSKIYAKDPTGEAYNVYRRIGWLEVFDADSFNKVSQHIVLVQERAERIN